MWLETQVTHKHEHDDFGYTGSVNFVSIWITTFEIFRLLKDSQLLGTSLQPPLEECLEDMLEWQYGNTRYISGRDRPYESYTLGNLP